MKTASHSTIASVVLAALGSCAAACGPLSVASLDEDPGSEHGDNDDINDGIKTCWTQYELTPELSGSTFEIQDRLFVAASEALLEYRSDGTWKRYTAPGYLPIDGRGGLWALAADDVWMAGLGAAWHFDGSMVTRSTAFSDNTTLNAIWAAASDDVWVSGYEFVGDDGGPEDGPVAVLYHYDGLAWIAYDIDVLGTGGALWGAASDDVWAATSIGLLHFDGGHWSLAGPDDTLGILQIWGRSSHDIWSLESRVAHHYDGTGWTTFDAPDLLSDVRGTTSGDTLFLGTETGVSTLWKFANGEWLDAGSGSAIEDLVALGGYREAPLLVGREEIVQLSSSGPTSLITSIRARPEELATLSATEVYGVESRRLLLFADGRWQVVSKLPGLFQPSIAVDSMGNIWIGAWYGDDDSSSARAWRWAPSGLEPQALPNDEQLRVQATYVDYNDTVWVGGFDADPSEVEPSGEGSRTRVLRRTGGVWEDVSPEGYTSAVQAISHGAISLFAVGDSGLALEYFDDRWHDISLDSNAYVEQVIALKGREALVSGLRGNEYWIRHWNGERWLDVPELDGVNWRSIAGTSADDVWAFGQIKIGDDYAPAGAHFDGHSWSRTSLPDTIEPWTVIATPGGELVGEGDGAVWVHAPCPDGT